MRPCTIRLLCGAASFALASPAIAKSCDADGALYYLGNTSGDEQSIWLSRTVPKGNFRLEAAQQQRLVDRWSHDGPGLRLSLSDSVSNGNGGTHKLYIEGDKPNDDCLIASQNQKLNFTLPPEFVRPPQKPGNNLPLTPHLPGGLFGNGSRPDQTLPTVPPTGVMPGLPSPPPAGVMPGLPSPPPTGVMPGLPSPPPTGVMPGLPSPPVSGVMPGLPSRPDQTLPTVPPSGVMPGLPSPPISGVMPGLPSRPDQTLPTVPPSGVMPGLPSPPVSGVMPGLPSRPDQTLPTVPPSGLMPGLPSPPVSGVMPGLPSRPDQTLPTVPPTGVMPGLPSPPVSGVMPGVPSRPDQTLPTVPPSGVMPGLPSPPISGVTPGLPSRPDQTLPTVPPSGVMPGLPSPPVSGVMPGLPSRPDQTLPTVPPSGVMPGLPSPPVSGVMPGLPSRPDQTLPTVPPSGVMPGLPSPPISGVTPGLPSRPDQTLPTVPPSGVMPGLPSPPVSGVMPGLPSRPDQTLPTVPPSGVMPGLPSPPVSGVMPGLPSRPDQTLPTVPPSGLMPGLPSPPVSGVMPGLPSRPDQTLPTVPPSGVMPGLPSPPVSGVMPGVPSRPDQTLPTVPPTGVMPGVPSRPDQTLPTVRPDLPPTGVMPTRPPLPGPVQPPSVQPPVSGIDLAPRERVVERPCPDRLVTDDDPDLDVRCRTQPYTEGRSDLEATLWDAWTDFKVSRISQSGRLDGVDGHTFMASAGLDRRVADGLIIGVSAMYNESRSESLGGDLDSQAIGLLMGPYLAWGFAPHLTLNLSANWGWTDSDVRLSGLATHLGTDVLAFSADVTLDTHIGGMALRPRAGLSYTHSEHPAHVLTGSLLGRSITLILPGDASDLASAELATEAAWPIALADGRLAIPFLELGAKYDFERPGGASFDTASYRIVSPGEWSGYAEGGFRFVLGGNVSTEISGAYRSIGVDGQDIWEGRLFFSLAF